MKPKGRHWVFLWLTVFLAVAGIVVAATASTINDSGNVANALFAVSSDPIIPASMTITIDPDVDIN